MELRAQIMIKELFTKLNLPILFSCSVGKGEQYYIPRKSYSARHVKFPPAKQEHIEWTRTITTLVDSWQPARRLLLSSPVEYNPQII